jgi:hypothetical protein
VNQSMSRALIGPRHNPKPKNAALAAAHPSHDSDTDTDSESDISDNEAMWYAMLLDNKLPPTESRFQMSWFASKVSLPLYGWAYRIHFSAHQGLFQSAQAHLF